MVGCWFDGDYVCGEGVDDGVDDEDGDDDGGGAVDDDFDCMWQRCTPASISHRVFEILILAFSVRTLTL